MAEITTSIYGQLTDAIAAVLAGVTDAPTPEIRETLRTIGVDAVPLLWVTKSEKGQKPIRRLFARVTQWSFPVNVALITAAKHRTEAERKARELLWQNILDALDTPLLDGAAIVWDTDTDPIAGVILQAEAGADYVVSVVELSYRIGLQRAA